MKFGAVEAGGTKFVCGIGSGPDDLQTVRIPTGPPQATIGAVISFLREAGAGELAAIGIGSFGPICTDTRSPQWGHITSTPAVSSRI